MRRTKSAPGCIPPSDCKISTTPIVVTDEDLLQWAGDGPIPNI